MWSVTTQTMNPPRPTGKQILSFANTSSAIRLRFDFLERSQSLNLVGIYEAASRKLSQK